MGLGLWGDGVPCNWDRTESVETFALNLPGQNGKYKPLRMPIVSISRKQISPHTFNDIMEVIQWSLCHCQVGAHPRRRHDGLDWFQSDKDRAKKVGQSTGVASSLIQVRGGWKFYNELFNFPAWNRKAGCCWRCPAKPDQASIYIHIYIYQYTCSYLTYRHMMMLECFGLLWRRPHG